METLELLGIAVGLAGLAGINLYLTVFASGLSIKMGWLTLAPQYESLHVLADPVILGIAGGFFIAEFFADKVPWIDTAWDAVHTFIRPVGAAFLAVSVMGETSPVFDVAVALLAGSVALSTHTAKASSRLFINASPEPFTNVGASFAGEGIVLGGLAITFLHPLIALVATLGVFLLILIFGPRMARATRARLRFLWKKITAPALRNSNTPTSPKLPVSVDTLLHCIHPGDFKVVNIFDATSCKLNQIPANTSGLIIATDDNSLYFVGKVWWQVKATPIDTRGLKVSYRRGFLCDHLTLHSEITNQKATLNIDRVTRTNIEDWLSKFKPGKLETSEDSDPQEASSSSAPALPVSKNNTSDAPDASHTNKGSGFDINTEASKPLE